MSFQPKIIYCKTKVLFIAILAICAARIDALALTMQECSTKYKAAQASGSLKVTNWADFRKTECGPGASPMAAATPNPAPASKPAGEKAATAASQTASEYSPALFPSVVAKKYSGEPAGKARMRTCLDQYHANQAANKNGGLKWREKGGGYYSECNKWLSEL